jgi:hypothetical protein
MVYLLLFIKETYTEVNIETNLSYVFVIHYSVTQEMINIHYFPTLLQNMPAGSHGIQWKISAFGLC